MFTNRGYVIAKRVVFFAMVFFLFRFPASALIINPTYDTTVTTNINAAQFEASFAVAVQSIETLFTNPVTINITVYWGTNGASNPFSGGIGLGASSMSGNFFSYSQIVAALRSTMKTTIQSNAVASLPASDPTPNGSSWVVPRAEEKALNLLASDSAHDGDVGFAADEPFDFGPTNRANITAFDFIGVAEHEITEVMGRVNFGLDMSGNYVPYDLFRFTNSGARSMSYGDDGVYFSINNGTNNLKNYDPPEDMEDIQDWEWPGSPPDSFDASAINGNENTLSYADLAAMNVLGYELNYKAVAESARQMAAKTMQVTFTNVTGMAYGIIETTNLATAITNWNTLGTPTEGPIGQYQFTDTQATNRARYYGVVLH